MEYLKRFLLWFLSGLGFALGVVLIVFGADKFDDLNRSSAASEPAVVLNSADNYVISDVAAVPVTEHVTVAGFIANKAETASEVVLNLHLMQGGKLLYDCEASHSLRPVGGQTTRFQFACPDVRAAKLPANVDYVVKLNVAAP